MEAGASSGVIAFAFAVWAAKEVYSAMRSETKKNTEATLQNTMVILELKGELKRMNELLAEVPRLRKDVDAAHNMIRQSIRPRPAPPGGEAT